MIRLSSLNVRRLFLAVLMMWFVSAVAQAQETPATRPATQPGNKGPVVVLITIGPGDEVWEKYGHNMLWVRDPSRGIDHCYNWGLFDFAQPNFIGKFVLGRMTYTMDAYPVELTMREYIENDRRTLMQRLDLTPDEVERLIVLCETNRLPANKDYKYDYFRDNCSTRVRDMIDRASNGRLRWQAEWMRNAENAKGLPPLLTYREQSVRLMQNDWWLMTGIDFALGPATDVPLTAWEACFVPMEMVPVVRPMAEAEREPFQSKRPMEPTVVPRRWPRMTAIGVLGAAAIVGLSRWRRFNLLSLTVWWTLCTVAAGFMLFMWLFTDHWSAYRNHNLLHFSPIAIVGLAMLTLRRSRLARWPAVVIVAVAVVGALLKFGGVLTQDNVAFIGLSLPINLAALWAAWRLTPAARVDEVAATPS